MNDLTGAKVLKDERILFNAFKYIYFMRKMKFENLLINQAFKKLMIFDICCYICVMLVVNNMEFKLKSFSLILS
jgi:hypothetical protein